MKISHQEKLRQHKKWVQELREMVPTHEDAIHMLAWCFVESSITEKELERLILRENDARITTQILSSSIQEDRKLALLEKLTENQSVTIATLAIRAKVKKIAASGGNKRAVVSMNKDKEIKSLYKANAAKYAKYSAQEAATYMAKHYPKFELKISTLQRKISKWRKESL